MNYLLTILVGLGFSFFLPQQQLNYELVGSVDINDVKDFSVDQFKNLYVVKGVELVKYDPDIKKLYSFSNPILGDIYQVDVHNALSPYVFYKDVNQLVVLDNRLNSSTALNFTDQGFLDVQFISFADQNNVWFYDQATDKLYRFNMQAKKTSNQSLNITQISKSENLPMGMISTIDRVYLNVPDKGIFVFDAVGAFEKLIPLQGLTTFAIRKNLLYGARDGKLLVYDLNTAKVLPVPIEEEGVRAVKLQQDHLYVLTSKGLRVYRQKQG